MLTPLMTLMLCIACLPVLAENQSTPIPKASPVDLPAIAGDALPRASVGDLINIKVYGESTISGQFAVNASGGILYPLIGQIDVYTLDSNAISSRIESLLEADYIRDASVTVTISKTEVSAATVLVFGGVRTPGQVSFPKGDDLQLSRAIAESGGFTELGRSEAVEIQRADQSGLTTYKIDLSSNEPFQLMDRDVIVVKEKPDMRKAAVAAIRNPPTGHVIIIGQVARPGKIIIPLNEPTSLITAIAMAGDFTRLARKSKVTITRDAPANGGKEAFNIDAGDIINGKKQPFMVRPGDTIYVPETRF